MPLPAAFITAACSSCRLPLSVVPGAAPSAAEADDGEAGGVSGGEDVPSVDMFLISMDSESKVKVEELFSPNDLLCWLRSSRSSIREELRRRAMARKGDIKRR